jgi:thioredoxin reductase
MKICIIGGGLSGTIACKYAVEKGHKPTILEKTNSTGGVYSLIYDKKNYKLSSSKYITSFSDHLPTPKNNIWMSIDEFQNYIDSYIEKYNLLKYFRFNCQVKHIEHFSDSVRIYYLRKNGKLVEEVFDKVIIATGLNQNPKYKNIYGELSFKGIKVHTHDIYTNPIYNPSYFFKGKKILIMGGGESSFDIGYEAVKYGNFVYYHTDNDVEWFPEGGLEVDKQKGQKFDKCFKNMDNVYSGKDNFNYFIKHNNEINAPNDTLLTRNEYSLNPLYSEIWQSFIAREMASLNYQRKCTHGIKELCKNNKRNVFAKYLVKRSNFLCELHLREKVKVLRNNLQLKGNKLFNGNEYVDEIDIIVYATGYKPKLEFLTDQIKNDTYIKNIIPKNHQNIAFIGFTRPTMGSILIISEMQSMWTMMFFENKLKYNIRKKSIFRSIDPLKLNNKFLRHLVINNYYLEDLAQDMKICPNLTTLYFKDRKLWNYLFNGMVHPMSYRLHGEYYDKNARENILDFYDQTFQLRNNKQKKLVKAFNIIRGSLTFLILITIILCILFIFSYAKLKIKNKL